MTKAYVVRLASDEHRILTELVKKGSSPAYKVKHANILLKADANGPAWADERIAEAFGCHVCTVRNVRKRLVEDGFDAALERKEREHPPNEPLLDGNGEARLIALACSTPPAARDRWTLELLADRLVQLKVVESISYETVRRTLKKTS